MNIISLILEKLFGSKREKQMEEPVKEELESEQMAEEERKEQETEEILTPAVNQLELSDEHALNKLYQLRVEQMGDLPYPRLLLEGCEDLPMEKLARELGRLRQALTSVATPRLKEAIPPQPKPSEKKLEPEAEEQETKRTESENSEPEKSESGKQEAEEPEQIPEPKLDALPMVFISDDKLKAWVMIFPPVGLGKEVDREMLQKALKDKGVVFGVKEERLDELPDNSERYFHLFQVAEGREVVQGKDGYIVDYFSRVEKRQIEMDERGRVDYTSLNMVQNASKGDVICEAIPPTEAVPGRTVLDQKIPGRDGKAAALPKGRNTEVSEDGSKLLASVSGRVQFSGRSFQIKSTLDIEGNVDYSTGNINFLGDVHIRGDICSGFTVRTVGNITVDGVVKAGTVEAGGDLVVVKGIVGNKEAIVRSHRNVYTKYLENCIVHARQNIYTDSILHSEVYCDGEIQVTSGRGVIVGGKVEAAQEINAKIVGNKSESTTYITLGGQPCSDFERELLVENIAELEKEMVKLERQPESPAKTKRMNKIRLDISVDKMKLGQLDKYLEKLEEKPEEQGGCRLKCEIAYPGMVLTIGNEMLRLTHETSSCNGRLVDGEIKLL